MALVLLLALAPSAGAAGVQLSATCTNLQATLNAVSANAVITLNSSQATGGGNASGLCTGTYTLPTSPEPADVGVTLQGNPGDGNADGFDGTNNHRPVSGTNLHRFNLLTLVFRNGKAPAGQNGGALLITGDSQVGLRGSSFFNNHADGGRGGAAYFNVSNNAAERAGGTGISENTFGSPTAGNSADVGGALSVESTATNANSGASGNTYVNNTAKITGGGLDWVIKAAANENLSVADTFTSNKAGGSGGGAHVVLEADDSIMRFDSGRFEDNHVQPLPSGPGGDHRGGGLFLEDAGAQVIQRFNRFIDNGIESFDTGNLLGGGEAIKGASVHARSESDQWTGNTVGPAGSAALDSAGGGLAFEGNNSTFHPFLGVVAGNATGGEGGGIYTGGGSTTLEVSNSTVAGNTVDTTVGQIAAQQAGVNSGIAGDGDTLTLTNSIVSNTTTTPDIGGFNTITSSYSDACRADHTAYPGAGNICADPQLRNPFQGDIHETPNSPTIDKGNDQLFFQEGEVGGDFEGDRRPVDGDGDGHTTDMGADESPEVTKPPPVTTPPVTTPPATQAGTATPQCSDKKDNDGDGATDLQDPGCTTAADTNEGDENLQALVLCGRREISLVRADLRGRKVVLSGLVSQRFAGQPVKILGNYKVKTGALTSLTTVKANASGQFTATIKRPPGRVLSKARFRARVDRFSSVALKLPQSLASSSLRRAGGNLELRGTVKRSLLGKRNPVLVRRLVCGHYRTVGQAKPDRKGRYVVRFSAPGLSSAALFRAETKVLARPRSRRYVKQFARAIGITLTGQSG